MDYRELYKASDLKVMQDAYISLNRKKNRIDELVLFAKQSGYTKIGIATCRTFTKEAAVLTEILKANGFEVVSVDCKYGRVAMSEFVDEVKGVACNPAGQANYLNEHNTDLNIVLGLCVGHDMIFNAKSTAPVSTLIVKDRALKHKTVEALAD